MVQCSLSDMSNALRGASDAKTGKKIDFKKSNPNETEHYFNAYNRVSYGLDRDLQKSMGSMMYIPHQFLSPSDMFGQEVVTKVDNIYNTNASNRDKAQAISNFGNSYINKMSDFMKPVFANYIQQRLEALEYAKGGNPLINTTNNIIGSIFESGMKNNIYASGMHLVQGAARLVAADADALGINAFQGILRSAQNIKEYGKLSELGILGLSDAVINKAANEAAILKYSDPGDRANLVSKTTYRYTFGDTPGYMTIMRGQLAAQPFALGRFFVRSYTDPAMQLYNVARVIMGDRSQEALQRASFSMRSLIGTGIINGLVFGSAASLPPIVNSSLSGIMHAAALFTGNTDYDMKKIWKQVDDLVPTNMLYKMTGVDVSDHFTRGIPLFAGPQALYHTYETSKKAVEGLGKSWVAGDMNAVGKNGLVLTSTMLPAIYGLGGPLGSAIKDANTLRLVKSSAYALGGDIKWDDVPHLWADYTLHDYQGAKDLIAGKEQSNE